MLEIFNTTFFVENDWRTLMIDEAYTEQSDRFAAIKNVMKLNKIYDDEIAKFVVDLISELLLRDSFAVSLRERLAISSENDEH